MRTQLVSTCRIDGIMFVASLGENALVAASPDKVIWYRVHGPAVEEVRHSSHDGRSFSLFPIHNHARAAFQLEHGPWNYSLQLLGEDGFIGRPIPIPFSWINQVTADSSGAVLGVFGSVSIPGRAGWIAPIESCLIDMESGNVERLPYSAVALQGDILYFVEERTLYKCRLSSFRHTSDSTEAPDRIASDIPSSVITLAPRNGYVRVVTTDGLYAVSSSAVTPVHRWEAASRALVCGDVCFTREIGPEVQVFHAKKRTASCVTSSPKTQVTGFDVLYPFLGDGADEGLLMIVSEKGVLDYFSWSCSDEK